MQQTHNVSNGGGITAREVMNTPVVAASATATAHEVSTYMLLGGFSGMPVVDLDGSILGIVTELDILRALRSGATLAETYVRDIMTREVVSVAADTSLAEVMGVLDNNRIQRVPVVEDGKIIGVVSRPDILRAAVNPQLMRVA
jgi:CBS domain-containing protein